MIMWFEATRARLQELGIAVPVSRTGDDPAMVKVWRSAPENQLEVGDVSVSVVKFCETAHRAGARIWVAPYTDRVKRAAQFAAVHLAGFATEPTCLPREAGFPELVEAICQLAAKHGVQCRDATSAEAETLERFAEQAYRDRLPKG